MVADLFHYGHVNFLKQARQQGDFLLVGVHADEAVMVYKRRPIFSMEERVASVEGCRYVDEVVANAPLTIDRAWIEKHDIDLVLHGDAGKSRGAGHIAQFGKKFYEMEVVIPWATATAPVAGPGQARATWHGAG